MLRAEEELAGAPVAGMVLISDGADNTSSMPGATPMLEQLLALRARQIPVYAIGVGSERFARDIELSRVEVPGTVLREASILVEVVVAQRGYAGTKVPVVVEDSGRIIGSREVALPKDGEATVVRIRVPASEKGARLLQGPRAGAERRDGEGEQRARRGGGRQRSPGEDPVPRR